MPPHDAFQLLILYDNVAATDGVTPDHGFAALVTTPTGVGLFDTGTSPSIFSDNLAALAVDLSTVDWIVLSHPHYDHVGGLPVALENAPRAPVIIPAGFPASIKRTILDAGAPLVEMQEPGEVAPSIFATGPLGGRIVEQALVIQTPTGLVILTGCSHPGIAHIIKSVGETWDTPVRAVMGGFHLMSHSQRAIREIVAAFRSAGVEKVGPWHCSGSKAQQIFAEEYGPNYLPGGVGRVVTF